MISVIGTLPERHAPRRRGYFARRARRSRQARPSRSWTPRAEAARVHTTRAGSDGRDKRDPPAIGCHAPRRRGYFARRVRRSRQARPSRRRTPRAEGEQCEATRWRSGETSWDCRTERSDVRRGPRRAPRPPPSPASHRARCAADQIERRGVAVKEASATGPVVLTVMRRFARSGNAERNGAARRPSGEKASKPTRSR